MVRQDSVLDVAAAGKLVEILTRVDRPVHLLQELSSLGDAGLGQTDLGGDGLEPGQAQQEE